MTPSLRTSARRFATAMLMAGLVATSCGESEATSLADVPFDAPDGASSSIADFAGRPLVLNMWATNCVPCVKEMPALDQVADELADDVQIIGVNVFDSPDDAAAFAADLGVDYPQFTDPDGALSTALAVTGLPATAFFDADGRLIELHQGAYTADELRSAIATLLPATSEGTES